MMEVKSILKNISINLQKVEYKQMNIEKADIKSELNQYINKLPMYVIGDEARLK